MSGVMLESPLPIPSMPLSSSEEHMFNAAVRDYRTAESQIFVPEAIDMLEAVVPALNSVGWVVMRRALKPSFVEAASEIEPEVARSGSIPSAERKSIIEASAPAMDLFTKISTIGLMDPGPLDEQERRYRVAPLWVEAILRHADYRYSHGLLANPVVQNGAQVMYELGGEEDKRANEAFAAQQVVVEGSDVLLLAGEAVRLSSEEKERIRLSDNCKPNHRTVTHTILPTARNARRLRMMSDTMLKDHGTINLPARSLVDQT